MNILKNKFVIALLLSVVLMGCFMKFNQYKNLNSEDGEGSQDESGEDETLATKAVKYLKQFVVSYGVSLLLVFLGFKGHDYYISKGSIDQLGCATSNKSVDSSKKNNSGSGSNDSISNSTGTHNAGGGESGGALSSFKSLFKSSSSEQESAAKTESYSPPTKRQSDPDTARQTNQQSGGNSDLVNDLNNERRLIMEKARLFKLKQQSLNNQNSKGEQGKQGEQAAQSGGNNKTSGEGGGGGGGNPKKTTKKEEYFNTGDPNF
jgi:hypothetical protein